jgi:hypothetical protein
VADEKKPDFDPDKTVVDVRRPTAPTPPADADRTIVTPAPSAPRPPAPSADDDRTMLVGRPPVAPPPGDDSERTMVTPRAAGVAADAERTAVRQAPAAGGPQPAAGGEFQLVCLSGHARGRRYPLSGPEVLIGSNPGCQLQFPGIESVHVKLVRQPDGFELQNVGAPGSVVMSGGRKPSRAKLKSGDLVKIRDVVLRYAPVGEVFSAEYDEKQFQGGLGTLFAPENRLYLGLGAAVVVVLLLFLWPSGPSETVVKQQAGPSSADKERQQEISALLQTGEVLFNAGKLLAPPDQPDADNAFAKFNEVLARDPGNEQARSWLKKIDEERDKQRRAREDAEKARLADQREREDQKRRDLEAKIAAIIDQGDAYFDKGQVTEPVGTNALAKYREALKIYPESQLAQDRVQKAINYYVVRGDELRDKNDSWAALENYRKASRATGGKQEEVERRIQEIERQLRSGMAGTTVKLVLYRDERGQLFVLDDMDKVPARYRDRAVEVQPPPPRPSGEGVE